MNRFQRVDRNRTSSRSERGATFVEYALIVAVLAIPTIGGVNMVTDSASSQADSSAEGISTRTIPPRPTTTQAPSPTTTAAPATTTTTTTAPTTTTTTAAPTTTTTAAPTTTTTPQGEPAWGSTSTDKKNKNKQWRANVDIAVRTASGEPIEDAIVVVKVEYLKDSDWTTDSNVEVDTDDDGVAEVQSDWYRRTGGNQIDKIRFTVISITKSGYDIADLQGSRTVDQP